MTKDKPITKQDHREDLIKRCSGKRLLSLSDLRELGHDLLASFAESGKWKEPSRDILAIEQEDRVSMRFYTNGHVYFISARLPSEKRPNGYLGATFTCRTPIAGEWWSRGGDLADGSYSEDTLRHIMEDIIAREIVPLADWID